jgi:alpha,alpha-trehalase
MPRPGKVRPAPRGAAGGEAGGPFPPHVLREYAFLADGERGALVGPRGDICWLCVPRWDSDAVFASLIGGAGGYAITPQARYVWGGHYELGTLIWRSTWITGEGPVHCQEALAYPGEPHRAVLLRRVSGLESPARVIVTLDLRAGFGRHGVRDLHCDRHGCWTGRAGSLYLRWSGGGRGMQVTTERRGAVLRGRLSVPRGAEHDLILEVSDEPLPAELPDPVERWRATRENWARAVPPLQDVIAPRDAIHACAVLTGMTSAAGGMVAAATTSLPERAEAGRNYDYRYAWIRDQCYAGQAAAAAGVTQLLDSAVWFVAARLDADGPELAPAYTVTGARVPDQRRLSLPGYPGGFDLVGNWVNQQFQLDAFGEALLLFASAAQVGRLTDDGRRAAEAAAQAVARRWPEKDAGIWEVDPQEWTHSRLICAAGLRAAGRTLASRRLAAQWSALADTIVADTAARGTHPAGRWQRSSQDPGLDGALLLAPVRGAVPADDPRAVATLDAYAAELTEDGYAYRFRHGDQPLGEAEGAFLLCGFLLALAYHQQGREVEARSWFERNRAACGPPALLTEEYDVTERQLRGNLPQAFVHALLLECAARLGRPWPDW